MVGFRDATLLASVFSFWVSAWLGNIYLGAFSLVSCLSLMYNFPKADVEEETEPIVFLEEKKDG